LKTGIVLIWVRIGTVGPALVNAAMSPRVLQNGGEFLD